MAQLGPSSPSCRDNQGPLILAVSYALLAIAIITVILRLHIRLGLRNGLNADDYTIVASLVSHVFMEIPSRYHLTVHQIAGIIGTSCLTKLVYEGLGRHVWCIPPEHLPLAVKFSTIAQMLNVIGIGLAKISVTLCVLRIIDRTRTYLALFLHVVIAFVSASHLSQIILFIVQCRPMAAIWNPHIHGNCFSPHITYLAGYIGFGLDAFTDLICAGIPIFILHRLHINFRTKLALCMLMGLGSLTAGCAIAKAVLLDRLFAKDYTWAITKPAFCTIIEHLSGITLVSLPALKPLFNRLLEEASSRLSSSGNPHSKRSSRATPPYQHYFHDHRRRHHNPRCHPTDSSSYALDKSLRSDDDTLERGEIPLCDSILKTTHFRVSSHNSVVSLYDRERRDAAPGEEWPLPAGSVHTAGSREREARRLGNSWRLE